MTDGAISLVAGIALLFLTGMSQVAVVVYFSAYAIILGVAQTIAASGEREPGKDTSYLSLLGIYSIVAGLVLLFFMGAPLSTVIILVGAYVIITGVAEMIASYSYRTEMGGYVWLFGAGSIRALFGIILLFSTGIALSTFIYYVAIYAIIEGLVTGVFGYEVRAKIGKSGQGQMV